MKPPTGVWGIDLGQCALKAIRLQLSDGQLNATAFDYVEYPKILSQPDADPDQLTREALEQFLSRNTLRGDHVAIAVPGQSGLARFVKLPPVEEKKIAEIVKFEAKQQIPFNLDEVVWDFQKLGASNVVDGFALETEIGLFAMKRDMVNKYLQHFKDVNVEVHVIQMAPLSLCNFVAYDLLGKDPGGEDDGKKSSVVALDIGADSSNLVITDGGKIIWQRPIPLGGNHFTRALTKDMKLTFAKAEHLKRNATKSGAAELKKILAALKPVLNDFVGEVQRSLGYFTNTHRDAQIEYMIGLGNAFRLPGLQRFLAEKLQLEVRKVDKLQRLEGDSVLTSPVYNDNILSFAVAYGLAIQGLARAKLVTNLLPGEIRLERLIRAKKPWAVAAAGVMLLGLGGAALGAYLDQRTFDNAQVAAAVKHANSSAADAGKMESAFQLARTNAIKEEDAVKAIVAGQSEQLNWIKFEQFVSQCIPQPDGKNLPPDTVNRYWKQKPEVVGAVSGSDAYQIFKQRIADGFKPADDGKAAGEALPPGGQDLIQFHIHGVEARYCDDLNAYWKKATESKRQGDVRPSEHYRQVLPDKEGWVIEVAGYTYHRAKVAFVRDTLLANIARLGLPAGAKPAAPAAPAPAPAPGPGVTPRPAVPGAAPAGQPVKDPFAETKEPVLNRISHVLLYNSISKPATESTSFEILNNNSLAELVAPAAPAGAPAAPAAPVRGRAVGPTAAGARAAATAADRALWVALGGRPDSAAAAAAAAGATTPATTTPTTTPSKDAPERTEFVILLIWKEPTPSDELRKSAATPGAPPPPAAPAPTGR